MDSTISRFWIKDKLFNFSVAISAYEVISFSSGIFITSTCPLISSALDIWIWSTDIFSLIGMTYSFSLSISNKPAPYALLYRSSWFFKFSNSFLSGRISPTHLHSLFLLFIQRDNWFCISSGELIREDISFQTKLSAILAFTPFRRHSGCSGQLCTRALHL